MQHGLIIIMIPFSLVLGIYGIILLNLLRKKFRLAYLDSFFYFQLLLLVFGVYGILGSLGMQELLDIIDIKKEQAQFIVHFIPFLGIPFVIAAWYMSLKMAAELIGKKVSQRLAIGYFTVVTLAFLAYGIVLRQMPGNVTTDYASLRQKIRMVFFSVELGIIAYIFLYIQSHLPKIRDRYQKKMLNRFTILLTATTLLTAISQYYAERHYLVFLYFLLLYFAGDLPLVFVVRNHLEKHLSQYEDQLDGLEHLCQKYGISKREKEIIREICHGHTNQQIADKLFITLQTVKDHNHHIYQKTGVKNRVQLAKIFGEAF